MVTDIFPSGVMLKPLTVFGVTLDVTMLSMWCPMLLRTCFPDEDMFVPELMCPCG